MQDKIILLELLRRPVAFHPIVARAVGSVKLGILWSQLYYWHDKGHDPDGWIYKTRKDIEEETALSRKEQETARRIARNLGLIEEKLAGNPARIYYKIDIERMAQLLQAQIEKQNQGQLPLIAKEKTVSTIAYLDNIPAKHIKEMIKKYGVSEKFIKDRADDVMTYCKAKGKSYKDYRAALQNFIKSHRGGGQSIKNVLPVKNGKYGNLGHK